MLFINIVKLIELYNCAPRVVVRVKIQSHLKTSGAKCLNS